jgi:3-hydroxy-5-phosphonooxypentane-2,4-dione thiolase
MLLRVSGGPSVLNDLSNERIVTPVKEAIRHNVVGVGVSIFVEHSPKYINHSMVTK